MVREGAEIKEQRAKGKRQKAKGREHKKEIQCLTGGGWPRFLNRGEADMTASRVAPVLEPG
jgi:hypothetical protein